MQANFLFHPESEYSGARYIILEFPYFLLLPIVDIILPPSNMQSFKWEVPCQSDFFSFVSNLFILSRGL